MPVSINRVMLAGNLTRDPQMKATASTSVAKFGLAVNRRYKGRDGEMVDEVTFVDVETWGRTAELVGKYLTKGRAAFIDGRLRLDEWQAQDGSKRSRLVVVADSVQFLDSGQRGEGGERKQERPQRSEAARIAADAAAGGDPMDEEPPF